MFERDYLNLGLEILKDGEEVEGRNGVTKQLFGTQLKFDLQEEFPILTTRKSFYKGVVGEFAALMNAPFDNVKHFEDYNCNYWKLWSKEDGALNVDYGNEGERVLNSDGDTQMSEVVRMLKEDPHSRRIILNYWNADNATYTNAFKKEQPYSFDGPDYKHPLYKTWEGEHTRCYNENCKDYKNYGERGITVSDEFHDFKKWVSYVESLPGFSKVGLSLARINNDKGYIRDNLRWTDARLQNLNTRMNSNNSSGYTGVELHNGSYRVRIMDNGKRIVIGSSYETAEAAAIARDEYIIKNDLDHRLSTLTTSIKQEPTKLSLHCCWYSLQFHVREDKYLDIIWNQRSCDLALGIQADAILASMFLIVIGNEVGLTPGRCTMNLGNTHLYAEHWEKFAEQAARPCHESPKWELVAPEGMDYHDFKANMFTLENYVHMDPIKYELKA